MTIQQVIEKAIEGGWQEGRSPKVVKTRSGFLVQTKGEIIGFETSIHSVFLDPLFWQSLGKAMGWWGENANGKPQWVNKWHRFIDHLAEGKDAESFFESLS